MVRCKFGTSMQVVKRETRKCRCREARPGLPKPGAALERGRRSGKAHRRQAGNVSLSAARARRLTRGSGCALRRRRASRRGGARAKATGKLCQCRIDAARCAGPEKQGAASLRIMPARSASSRRFQRCAERRGFLLKNACRGRQKLKIFASAGPLKPRGQRPGKSLYTVTWGP